METTDRLLMTTDRSAHHCLLFSQVRDEYHQCCELLSRHSQQFRAIQKRLLSRFKDKTPSSLAHMDTLLDGTYLQVCVVCVL